MSDWTVFHEELLQKWLRICKTYSLMHGLSSRYYANINKGLGLPVVILGALTTSSIFSSITNTPDFYSSEVWNYVNGFLSLSVTVLSGVSNFLGAEQKLNSHQTSSVKYSKICFNIESILAFPKTEREIDANDFVKEIKKEIMELQENSIPIPSSILSRYIRKLDKNLLNTKCTINNTESKSENDENINIKIHDSIENKKIDRICQIMEKNE